MSEPKKLLCLKIDSPLISKDATNYRPKTWPLPSDFPIVVDHLGNVISRYSDQIWILTIWSNKVSRINFGDGPIRSKAVSISPDNGSIFRQIVAWTIYGPGKIITVDAVVRRVEILRPLFSLCSEHGILATDIQRYPLLIEELASRLAPSSAAYAVTLLHDLWDQRSVLGLTLLDLYSLNNLAKYISPHEKDQTPYIPPRIWDYQVRRLRECLDDFLAHKQKIMACYHFCLSAYAHNAGSLASACRRKIPTTQLPFYVGSDSVTGALTGAVFHGYFMDTAARFGISDLLNRWVHNTHKAGVSALSTYFNLISFVGTAYIINFSLMRIDETNSLRADCLSTERDVITGEDIYIISGETTKTIEDDDARWITSPSAAVAVEAMTCIARLRMIAAEANPDVPTTEADISNPSLSPRPYEPWRKQSKQISQPLDIYPAAQSYASLVNRYFFLFNEEEIRITKEDLRIARLLNPTLDPEKFDVGKTWIFAWHQLRRTGAVNMRASSLVSDPSVQYQLKHLHAAMSRYYGQRYYHLDKNLNNETRVEYLKTSYEMIAREFKFLQSSRFISPHGEARKSQIIKLVDTNDHESLVKAAKAGKIAYKENLLGGGCTNTEYCAYGGFENIARCGGGDGKPMCSDLMLDRERIPQVIKLRTVIAGRLEAAPVESPLHLSLHAQLRAVENALNVFEKHK